MGRAVIMNELQYRGTSNLCEQDADGVPRDWMLRHYVNEVYTRE